MCILVFDGDQFLPEYKDDADTNLFKGRLQYKYSDTLNNECPNYKDYCHFVASGRMVSIGGMYEYEVFYRDTRESSR